MQLSKRQIYVISFVSILCYMCLYKSTSKYTEVVEDVIIEVDVPGPEDCDDTDPVLKRACDMRNQILMCQPKFVWVPDADLRRVDNTTTEELIKFEKVSNMTTRDVINKLMMCNEHVDRLYLGFRPLENDEGFIYYVDKGTPSEKFNEYFVMDDHASIGFYLLVNIPNFEYTNLIQMRGGLLKFGLHT